MSICSTSCNVCNHIEYNSFLDCCTECGSNNVDAEYDPDLDNDEHFIDTVDNSDFDKDDERCGGE